MLSESEMAPDFCEVPRKLSLVVPVAMCVCVCVLTRFLLSIYAIYLSSATIRAAPSESEKKRHSYFFFPDRYLRFSAHKGGEPILLGLAPTYIIASWEGNV